MNEEKKKFITPYLEIVSFNNSDIITLSRGDTVGDGGDNEEEFGY